MATPSHNYGFKFNVKNENARRDAEQSQRKTVRTMSVLRWSVRERAMSLIMEECVCELGEELLFGRPLLSCWISI